MIGSRELLNTKASVCVQDSRYRTAGTGQQVQDSRYRESDHHLVQKRLSYYSLWIGKSWHFPKNKQIFRRIDFWPIFSIFSAIERFFSLHSLIMPGRIDPHLLQAIQAEFEFEIRPARVLNHCRSMGTPVSTDTIYRLYNGWRESGAVSSGLTAREDRSLMLCAFMIEVSYSVLDKSAKNDRNLSNGSFIAASLRNSI